MRLFYAPSMHAHTLTTKRLGVSSFPQTRCTVKVTDYAQLALSFNHGRERKERGADTLPYEKLRCTAYGKRFVLRLRFHSPVPLATTNKPNSNRMGADAGGQGPTAAAVQPPAEGTRPACNPIGVHRARPAQPATYGADRLQRPAPEREEGPHSAGAISEIDSASLPRNADTCLEIARSPHLGLFLPQHAAAPCRQGRLEPRRGPSVGLAAIRR